MKYVRRFLIAIAGSLLFLMLVSFILPLDQRGTDPAVLADDSGQFITVDDITLYVRTTGQETDPPIIMIHGAFGSTETWRYNRDAIAEAGYYVIAFDRPGYGLSDKPVDFDYTCASQADLIASLMNAFDINQAHILGHSAGGCVLTEFALRHPDRLNEMILVAAALPASTPVTILETITDFPPVSRWIQFLAVNLLTRDRLESLISSFYADSGFMTDTDYDTYWRAFQTPGWAAGLVAMAGDQGKNTITDSQIQQITIRTLLLWGEMDTTTPLMNGQHLDNLLPDSQLVTLADAGHQPMEEVAEAFNQAVITFLNESE